MRKPTPEGGPERLVTLADGVFAIAITLLVLDLSVPPGLDSAAYHEALREVLPNLGAYGISLGVLAGFWRDHRMIFSGVRQVDAQVVLLTMLGLGLAALLPFPTTLVSDYGHETVSVVVYAATVASLGTVHLVLLLVITRRPWLCGDEQPRRNATYSALDMGSTVAVFLVTIPLALLMGPAAMWWWLVLVPVKVWLGRREVAAR
ncbi:TMEM175 family protein [Streptomyces sp. 15-116A]|uniref:TMEM175 family protein n=1 Tax=Streptomyces sp. 15-116A TaxID=2259035 RepID=UPI0021B31643|nr:TMEM175 family protein [Streptomyces sp. 15-116A]MCT7351481.1 TMEM175 family protein [Streptomyces sp. 15-116A]